MASGVGQYGERNHQHIEPHIQDLVEHVISEKVAAIVAVLGQAII